ncbi:hypothetical protein SDRG_07136 [Saprolegnia diclina VS20]|uniref:RGS domain-containing protein n=1 Tax=Saprolegnia diclina (strain VS20) TaxID=1156394 RepID=T0QL47_SAPDV|nr:hypothetical protein SDRG_07136 [Saprolegnia diclina VS20]EQC35426.1 hypothetical protein SDRG_07136 [Saprolegnia diclina VS20]|eukprot:XP_008611176.1 hypothetical protein SDRG_07136 [Saprolegnia diclina VS20]
MEPAPLIASVVLSSYMPAVLGLYLWHRKHRWIRSRRPVAIASIGAGAYLGATSPPLLRLLDPRGALWCHALVVWIALTTLACTWFLLVASSLVVRFKLAEALLQHRDPTRSIVSIKWCRRFLMPTLQSYLCLVATALALFSVGSVMSPEASCWTPGAVYATVLVMSALVVASLYVARHLQAVDDLDELHKVYRRTIYSVVAACSVFGLVSLCAAKLQWYMLSSYGLDIILAQVAPHTFYGFHVVPSVHRIVRTGKTVDDAMEAGAVHGARDIAAELYRFHTFLQTSEGARAFLDYCRLALHLDAILSWEMARRFPVRVLTRKRAWKIFATCIDVSAPLQTRASAKWRHYYIGRLQRPRARNAVVDTLPDAFFEPLVLELVTDMFLDLLPAFERHPLGAAWREFLYETLHSSQRPLTDPLASLRHSLVSPTALSSRSDSVVATCNE